jgi:guanylate kinase
MELILDFVKILLPAATVLYAMYLVVKSFLNKEYAEKQLDIKTHNAKVVLPIRLQAYERICLFLERISMNNLIIRVNEAGFNSKQLQQKLLSEIRNEYNHNLSQQVYVSNEAWNLVKKAVEDTIGIINTSAQEINPENRGIELAKKIFENIIQQKNDSVSQAIIFTKEEIRALFE